MKFGPATIARAAALGVVLTRVAGAAWTRPPVGASTRPPTTISVVIPARNEASRIGPLLDAVVDAPGVVEVVVVDDESRDRTGEIAAAAGARVIAGRRRPAGWAGKSWALEQGVAAACGEWIVTLDADTRPRRELPGSLVARADRDGTDLLTVAGRFTGRSRGARWLHAAMLTSLVYRFGPPGQRSPQPAGRVLANGQCMVFRRARLIADGGLEPVAGAVVEDVALARHLAGLGRRVDFLDAGRMLDVELYGSFAATWSGWGRSLGLPGVEPRVRQLGEAAVLVLSSPIPLLRLLSGRSDAIDAIAAAVRLGTLAGTRKAFARSDLAYWLSPLADLVAAAAVARSALATIHTWSGRTYVL